MATSHAPPITLSTLPLGGLLPSVATPASAPFAFSHASPSHTKGAAKGLLVGNVEIVLNYFVEVFLRPPNVSDDSAPSGQWRDPAHASVSWQGKPSSIPSS